MAEAVLAWLMARLAMPRLFRRVYAAVCKELASMLLDEAARQDAVLTRRGASMNAEPNGRAESLAPAMAGGEPERVVTSL